MKLITRPHDRFNGRLFVAVATLAALALACGAGDDSRSAGERLYNAGNYSDALPLLRREADEQPSGATLYQLGYSMHVVQGDKEARRALWAEARPRLEAELDAPDGLSLDRLYYLAVIALNEEDFEAMRSFATRAVEEIEKGPEMTLLTGADWFRLARLHDFLQQQSEAEAAYRRSVSAFRANPAANPAYQALALAQVADFDYGNLHYQAAALGYDEALKLMPETDQVKPYRHGLTLLATGRYEEAIERLKSVRDPETTTEAQYATDIARKAEVVKPLSKDDVDGIAIAKMPLKALEDRVREAAARLQESRTKYSYKPGDPLSAELRERQSRFIALLLERLMRQGKIQDFCLNEGMAELVRR